MAKWKEIPIGEWEFSFLPLDNPRAIHPPNVYNGSNETKETPRCEKDIVGSGIRPSNRGIVGNSESKEEQE